MLRLVKSTEMERSVPCSLSSVRHLGTPTTHWPDKAVRTNLTFLHKDECAIEKPYWLIMTSRLHTVSFHFFSLQTVVQRMYKPLSVYVILTNTGLREQKRNLKSTNWF